MPRLKSYNEQAYPYTLHVLIRYANGDVFADAIKGLNFGHALYRARWNWPDASDIRPAQSSIVEYALGVWDDSYSWFGLTAVQRLFIHDVLYAAGILQDTAYRYVRETA